MEFELIGNSLAYIIMVLPSSNLDCTVLIDFFSFAVSPTINPHSFEIGTVSKYFSEITMWLAILKLTFFYSTVMPAFATYPIFLVCGLLIIDSIGLEENWTTCSRVCSLNLAEVVINSSPIIFTLEFLSHFSVRYYYILNIKFW